MNARRAGRVLVVAVLLASGCRVQGRIQEGRKVSMDPCKLVGLDKAQSVMGAPMYQQLDVGYTREGQPYFDECRYQFSGSYEWPNLVVEVADETHSAIRNTNLTEPLRGLGREARYRHDEFEPFGTLNLEVLSDKGASLSLSLRLKNSDEPTLLSKARSLAGPAVEAIERQFPATEKPPTDEPPIPVCSSVGGSEGMIEIYKPFWTPPAGKSILLSEELNIGGPEGAGAGPVGGGWLCDADIDPHVYGGAGEVYHPHARWWISKATPPAEPLPGSKRVQRLGATAFSRVVDASWYYGGKSLELSVFSKGGKHFEVEVSLSETEESVGENVARGVAERILANLP